MGRPQLNLRPRLARRTGSRNLGHRAGIHGSKHETIRHRDKIYVRGEVHTNTVESASSLFKRGLTGAFHKVSLKHLQRYLNEFSFRFNNRKDANLFGLTVRRLALAGNMTYAQLTEENAFTPFIRPK